MRAPVIHEAEARLRALVIPKLVGFRKGRPMWLIEGGATGVAMSDYLENELLDHVLSASAWSAPATTYIALYTVTPGDAGGGTEVSGGSYARVAYTNNITNWPAASGGSKSNANVIDFGTATANWGTIVAVSIMDAATAGNFLFYGSLTASKTVNNGDGFKFLATKLSVAFD